MHDKNGTPLQIGDQVILAGTITEITSDQPTYCNITVCSHEGMAPGEDGYKLALSARMVVKGALLEGCASPAVIQDALRGAAVQIRALQKRLSEERCVARAREDVLQTTIERLSNRGRDQDCGANTCGEIDMTYHLDRVADSFTKSLPRAECADGVDGVPAG